MTVTGLFIPLIKSKTFAWRSSTYCAISLSSASKIYLLGGGDNYAECNLIMHTSINKNTEVLAGRLSYLQSAALMRSAAMNYTNDSAPLHFASAVNAPVQPDISIQ